MLRTWQFADLICSNVGGQLNEDKDVADHPTNRAGRPADIADAVEYLVNAGFVTGQDITVDGGATRKKK
jgi:NAD(P)-dependent dehydrogenase (short-subunit alcohol dehydrogenase family)